MKKPKPRYTDAQILNWLQRCSKIDLSGYDGGYAFERIFMTDEPVGVVDIRLAVKGGEYQDGLRKQAAVAMAAYEDMAKEG